MLQIVYRPLTICMKVRETSFWGQSSMRGPVSTRLSSTGFLADFATFAAAKDWHWQFVIEQDDLNEKPNLHEGRWSGATIHGSRVMPPSVAA